MLWQTIARLACERPWDQVAGALEVHSMAADDDAIMGEILACSIIVSVINSISRGTNRDQFKTS